LNANCQIINFQNSHRCTHSIFNTKPEVKAWKSEAENNCTSYCTAPNCANHQPHTLHHCVMDITNPDAATSLSYLLIIISWFFYFLFLFFGFSTSPYLEVMKKRIELARNISPWKTIQTSVFHQP